MCFLEREMDRKMSKRHEGKKKKGLNGLQRNYNIPDITTALTYISLTIYKVTTNVNL
jgi:hypothetical protein